MEYQVDVFSGTPDEYVDFYIKLEENMRHETSS